MSGVNPIWMIVIAFMLALVPILVGMVTSYVKISIVLGMLRSGLGAQQVPGNMVIMALSFAMTLFVLSPVLEQTSLIGQNDEILSFLDKPTIKEMKKLKPLLGPWTEFLTRHAGEREVFTLQELKAGESELIPSEPLIGPEPKPKIELLTLVPAFILTELKEAFAMGFVLLLPFLVVDLLVANILVGMGMFMVSPVMIALPLKLMLFVACDGWNLLTRGLVQSYV